MADHSRNARHNDGEPVLSTILTESPELAIVVEQFVRGLPERMSAIEDALRHQSFDRLARLAHQLKGIGGSHGYSELTRQAGSLEAAAHSHSIDELSGKLDEMATLVARIQAGLHQEH